MCGYAACTGAWAQILIPSCVRMLAHMHLERGRVGGGGRDNDAVLHVAGLVSVGVFVGCQWVQGWMDEWEHVVHISCL